MRTVSFVSLIAPGFSMYPPPDAVARTLTLSRGLVRAASRMGLRGRLGLC
jgi:hypothetical protein